MREKKCGFEGRWEDRSQEDLWTVSLVHLFTWEERHILLEVAVKVP